MYAGHVGAALGARALRRTVPIWLLVVAAQLPDWMDAGACTLGLPRGPGALYTHGFGAVGIAAATMALLFATWTRDARGALVLALLVLSHWPLDFVTGLKPTWSGGPVVGLDLYSRPGADVLVEGAVIVAGWLVYRRTLPREARAGSAGRAVAGIAAALLALQVAAGVALALQLGGRIKC